MANNHKQAAHIIPLSAPARVCSAPAYLLVRQELIKHCYAEISAIVITRVYTYRVEKNPRQSLCQVHLEPLKSFLTTNTPALDPSFVQFPVCQRKKKTNPLSNSYGCFCLNPHALAVVRRPDASDRWVDTLDRFGDPLELLSAGIP